jgi:hypothetical protein
MICLERSTGRETEVMVYIRVDSNHSLVFFLTGGPQWKHTDPELKAMIDELKCAAPAAARG